MTLHRYEVVVPDGTTGDMRQTLAGTGFEVWAEYAGLSFYNHGYRGRHTLFVVDVEPTQRGIFEGIIGGWQLTYLGPVDIL